MAIRLMVHPSMRTSWLYRLMSYVMLIVAALVILKTGLCGVKVVSRGQMLVSVPLQSFLLVLFMCLCRIPFQP